MNAIAAFNEVWPLVQKEIKVPEGYTMKYFGEQESQVESNEALAKNLPLTFFLMFVTLLFLFRTYRKPTVILLMLPLIFIGIVLGLVLLGKSFDFFSILGLLGLIGMNIKMRLYWWNRLIWRQRRAKSRWMLLSVLQRVVLFP